MDTPRDPDDGIRDIVDADVLKAFTNPLRSRLYEMLALDGPATVGMLAERAGAAVGSVSHHLGILARAGLIVEAPELARDAREHWWQRAQRGIRWSSNGLADAAGREIADSLEAQMLDQQHAQARAWLAERDERPGWADVAFAHQSRLWLDQAELAELGQAIADVLREFADRDPEGREAVLVWARAFPNRP